MIKVLFLCHGNICRSPMAEFVFKDISKKYKDNLYINSKAVSCEELGSPIYFSAQKKLKEKNIPFDNHVASQITVEDYNEYDYIVVMDERNISRLMRIIGSDTEKKVYKLLDFVSNGGDIEDPWYSGNFEKVFCDIFEGCQGLLQHLIKKGEI